MDPDRPTRLALVHSFYSRDQPSGENEVVYAERDSLRRAGYEVLLVARETDREREMAAYRSRAMARTALGVGNSPLLEISEFSPDVVHVHNLFPNFGVSWTRKLKVPLVVTLHNYRAVCAKATLLRDGQVCTSCFKNRLEAVRHACYRDLRRATIPLTLGQPAYQRNIVAKANAIIFLSKLQKEYVADSGIRLQSSYVVPNFLPDRLDVGAGPGGEAWLFAGRLDAQKGILEIVENWPRGVPLRIVGTGPYEARVRTQAEGKSIQFLGQRSRGDVLELLRNSRGLVFGSRSPEPFGLVYLEALAAGTPVLATPPSAVATFVDSDGTGLVAPRLSPNVVLEASLRFPGLRDHARRTFEAKYTEKAHVENLARVYRDVQR